MNDMDFSRYYRHKHNHKHSHQNTSFAGKLKSKLMTWTGIIFFFFVTGMIIGMQWQKKVLTDGLENQVLSTDSEQVPLNTANIAPQQETSQFEDLIKERSEKLEKQHGSSNVSNKKSSESKDKTQEKVKDNGITYLIYAKSYSDREQAYLHGRNLKKGGFPVFLARSGEKMKVYIGPVTGKKEAYNMLARVTRIPEFKGAILYEK